MLTARKYRDRASKRVILSIGSRLKGNAFDLPVPCEMGHGFEPSSFIFRVEPSRSAGGSDPVTDRSFESISLKAVSQTDCRSKG
jgi:hypothetical protein